MPAPNPHEGWGEFPDAQFQERIEQLGDEIVNCYPGFQADVEGIMFDPSTDYITKHRELEELHELANNRLAIMREEIGPVVISPWYSEVPTEFDKLIQQRISKPYDQAKDSQETFSDFEKGPDSTITKLFTRIGMMALRSPFGWVIRPKI